MPPFDEKIRGVNVPFSWFKILSKYLRFFWLSIDFIVAERLCQRMQRAFMDSKVFYPFAPSYRSQSLSATMKSMESQKKRKYLERILNQENGTFTPLIFSSNGGMSKETKRFYSRLAELISDKTHAPLPDTAAWIKRKLFFSLIRSSVICIRGSRCHKCKCLQSLRELDIDSDMSQMPSIET
jgi:hypothetical protein